MEEIIYQKSYEEYKMELDGELQKTAEGFVRIGYLLKVARDTNVLATSGYKTVAEFAQAEYNLDKTQVSRFISINDKFSEGGYSDRLQADYRNYGYAKLTIMLQLPDEVNDLLDPTMSKAEIQSVHAEYKEEMQKTDLEVLMEEPMKEPERQQDREEREESLLDKAIYLICRNEPELYEQAYCEWQNDCKDGLYDAFVPNEEQLFIVRIPALGKMILSIKGMSQPVKMANMRSGEQEEYNWDDVVAAFARCVPINPRDEFDAKKCWEDIYGEHWPVEEKKETVAPVQQEKTKPKKEKSKVKVVKDRKEKDKPVEKKKAVPDLVEEIQEPVTEVIDAEYREIDNKNCENDTEIQENDTKIAEINTENVEKTTSDEPSDEQIEELKCIFNQIIDGCDTVVRYLKEKGWSPLNVAITPDEYEDVKDVYKNVIDAAAGFEKLMMKMEEWTHGK